jgi:predicted RNA-binding Zn-ribbon protein involved in translation (DUF1610 family)
VSSTITGFSQASTSNIVKKTYCDTSDLVVAYSFPNANITSTGVFESVISHSCPDCTAESTNYWDDSDSSKFNYVYSCQDCIFSSATAIHWEVKSDNLYSSDDNRVSGYIIPPYTSSTADNTTVPKFRGTTSTEVTIRLIPAEYQNAISGVTTTAYRLQFDSFSYGSYGKA